MKRSIFLWWATFGGIIGGFFSATIPSHSQNQIKSGLKFYPVGTIEQLQQEGSLLTEDLEIGAVLIRFNQNGSLIAIDPTCTHAGCLVEWDNQAQAFICPCHGSKFTETGELIEGLASINLTKYQVKTEGKTIFVVMNN